MNKNLITINRATVDNILKTDKKNIIQNVINSGFTIVDTNNNCLERDYLNNNYKCSILTPLLYDFTVNLLNGLNKEDKKKCIFDAVDYYVIKDIPIDYLKKFLGTNFTDKNKKLLFNFQDEFKNSVYIKIGDKYINLLPFHFVLHAKSIPPGYKGIIRRVKDKYGKVHFLNPEIKMTFNFYFSKGVFKPLVTGNFQGDGFIKIPQNLTQKLKNIYSYKLFLYSKLINTHDKYSIETDTKSFLLYVCNTALKTILKSNLNKTKKETSYLVIRGGFENTIKKNKYYELMNYINDYKTILKDDNLGKYLLLKNLYIENKKTILYYKAFPQTS